MGEIQLLRMQGLAIQSLDAFSQNGVMTCARPTFPPVEWVSQNGMTDGREVYPDLMSPPGLGKYLKERRTFKFLHLPPARDGGPSSPGPG